MKELLIYILQVSVLMFFAYLAYKLVFAKDAFHSVKRFVLIFMVVSSFTLPIFRITTYQEVVIERTADNLVPNNPNFSDGLEDTFLPTIEDDFSSNWFLLIGIIYLLGVFYLFIYRVLGVLKVRDFMSKAVNRHIHNRVEVLLVVDDISAFGFGNKIVMSQKDYNENRDMIMAHEMVHIKQHHSADLLLINLALSLQWFNPFVWYIRRELILTHEFLADRGVIQSGIDVKKYQYLLISKNACSLGLIPVVNHFGNSDLHKRIRTMKRKTSKLALLKLLVMIPLVSVALVAFAETKYEMKQKEFDTEQEESIQEKEKFCMPYQGRIKIKYGQQITDPINKKQRIHPGVDVIVTNDTLRVPYSGVVKYADFAKGGHGNKLVIIHNDRLETTYTHLAKFFVSEGDIVKSGEVVAIVGSTGRSTGKHLHFECSVDGELTDPELALPLSK